MRNEKLGYWFLADVWDKETNISYFVGANVNGLFAWKHNSNEIELLDNMEDCLYDNELYDCGLIRKNKVFFPPKNTSMLMVYDTDSHKVEYRELYSEEIKKQIDFKPSYFGHLVYKDGEDNLYFFYREYPIVTILKENDTVQIQSLEVADKIVLQKIYCENDGILYFPTSNTNMIITYDIKLSKFNQIVISNKIQGFSSCIYDNGYLVLMSADAKHIIKYKIDSAEKTYFRMDIGEIDVDDLWQIKKQKDRYLIIPFLDVKKEDRMKCLYVLDRNFNITEIKDIDEHYSVMKKWSIKTTPTHEMYALFECVSGDDGDMFWAQNMKMISLDYQTLEIKEIEYPYPKGFRAEMMLERIKKCQVNVCMRYVSMPIYECERINLKDYLDFLI